MGQVFSSFRPRQASNTGTESRQHPNTEITRASRPAVVVEPPARVLTQNAANHEREDARGKGTEPSGSRSPGPDSANAHLCASWLGHGDGSTVISCGCGPGSLHKGRFDHNRLSRSSLALSDSEMIADSDARILDHRRAFRDRRPLRNIDESLVNALSETSALPTDNPVYDGMFVSTTPIHAPYEALFYSRKMIFQATKTDVEETRKHAQRLLTDMEQELAATWAKSLEIDEERCEKIAFEHLWLLYSPGETVFRQAGGEWRAYKVARVETGERPGHDPILISAYYLGFDKTGRSLVPHLELLEVNSYRSERPVVSLEVVPKWYIEKHMKSLFSDLKGRGKRYWKYRGKPFYQEHRGDAWSTTSSDNYPKVIVDYTTSSRYDVDIQPELPAPLQCVVCLAAALKLGPWSENSEDTPRHLDVCKEKSESVKSANTETDDHFLYCPSMVWAFSLEHMSWKMVSPNTLRDVSPKEKNWNLLCMCEESKAQLDSMVAAYSREWEARQRPRKELDHATSPSCGRRTGYSIRFHGGTGTGKTFTAECLAEKHGRPLYRVPCGSIGMTPSDLEPQLRTYLIRAANWGAILLFEDADIFVQERDGHNGQRSALNSLFFYHLSQSDALAIFTTSQKSRADKSFQSRTYPELYFEPLSFDDQKSIWLHLLGTSNLTEESFSACVRFIENKLKDEEKGEYQRMNGWQIENCVGAALALAKMQAKDGEKAVTLRKDHIRKVLGLQKKSKERLESWEDPSSWIRIPPDADG